MRALFGGGSKKPAPQAAKPAPDKIQTMQQLTDQIDKLELRIKKLEVDAAEKKREAVERKKRGDTRGAVTALKTSKMKDAEMVKLEGMKLMIEQNKMQIESAAMDSEVFSALKTSNDVIKQQNAAASIEAFDDLKADMEEQQELM